MSKTGKRVLIAGICLLVLAALAIPKLPLSEPDGPAAAGAPSDNRLRVETYVVEPVTLRDRVVTTGTLMANEEVDLRSEVSGKVEEIHFEEGRAVSKGDLLVKINDSELQAQLKQAVYREKLAVDREFRERALLDKGGISQEQYDATLNEVNVLQSGVELIRAQIEKTEVRAPFDGVVGLRHVSVGSYISPIDRIATIQDIGDLKMEFSIPERYASRVSVGSAVTFRVEGFDRAFEGRVYAYEPRIEAGTRTLTLRARAPNAEGQLLPGGFANIELVFNEIEGALSVPSIAVIPVLGGQRVFLYKGGQAQEQAVDTGIRTEERVQITTGLTPQDTVIVSGIQQLRPGMAVRLSEGG